MFPKHATYQPQDRREMAHIHYKTVRHVEEGNPFIE
jgi:hypothetical protein